MIVSIFSLSVNAFKIHWHNLDDQNNYRRHSLISRRLQHPDDEDLILGAGSDVYNESLESYILYNIFVLSKLSEHL